MSDSQQLRATLHAWDARSTYPDGLTGPVNPDDDLTELLERLAAVIATGGHTVVLPGPTPHEALIIAMDGPGDGHVIEGSTVFRPSPYQE